ncbi:MAG: glycoside hydrolase family 16 protein [Planctomycetota bacterium]|jgi:beta-glucanase (GH16 family)
MKIFQSMSVLLVIISVAFIFSSSAMCAPAGYVKIWEDTFDGTSLDTSNWTIGLRDPGTGDLVPGAHGDYLLNTGYAGYNTAEDVWVSGGSLYLQNQKRSYTGTNPAGSYDYTTGWIMSMHKVYFNKGYVEMRAQFPSGDKVWPALWLIAEDLIWGPEWDMFEYFGYRSDYGYDVMLMNLAYGSWPSISWLGDRINNYDTVYDCEAWHIYGFEWTADYAKFYIDDILVYQMNNTIGSNWPDEEMYIVLNNGVRTDSPNTNTTWPNYVIMDYIELYQLLPAVCDDGTCDSGEDQCNCPEDCGSPPSTETTCDDGVDEDCDGNTDCDDSDCDSYPVCDFVTSFYDDFESSSNWSTNWIATGAWNRVFDRKYYEGSYSAEIDGSVIDSALVSQSIDVSSKDTATITFQWLIENGLDTGEYLAFDVDTGSGWVQMADRLGEVDTEDVWAGEEIVVDVSSASTMSIRFIGNMNRSNEDAYVDLVEIITTSNLSCGSGGPCGFADLANMAQHWLSIEPSADYYDDGTGIVDFKDFGVLSENWTGQP